MDTMYTPHEPERQLEPAPGGGGRSGPRKAPVHSTLKPGTSLQLQVVLAYRPSMRSAKKT